MASWFVSGRPALMAALENVCRQIDDEMEAEVNCNYKDAAIDERPNPVTHDASVQTDEPDIPSPEHLKRAYIKLQRKYEALDKQFKTAKDAIATAKSERSGWRRYAEQLERSISHAQNIHGIEIAVLPLPGTVNHEPPDALKEQSAVRGSSVQSADENLAEHSLLPSTVPGTSQTHSDQPVSQTHDSTASTQDGSEQGTHTDLPPLPKDSNVAPVTIKQEISSDTPVFVSEKILRKRRRTEEAQATARAIKPEPSESGSSPLVSLHHCSFVPQESFDLDATAQVVDTPRKRRQLQIIHEPTQPERVPPMAPPPVAAASASPRVPEETRTPRQPYLSSFSSALTPVDVNRRPQRSAPAASTEKRMKKGLSDGIGSLAEDSGGYRPDGRDRAQMPEASKGRLDSLLNSPSPAQQSASILRPIRRAKDTQGLPNDELGIPKPRALPFDQSGRATPKRPSDVRTPQSARTPLAETTNNSVLRNRQPPKGSLRTKKVAELQLDDFRINPKSNEGLDYAFSDVVRNKDERACLQGCVADDCCGPQFRGLAQAERPKEPLTGLQRQEEQKLLEEYLGDDAWKIGQMGPEERLKTWIEAKARQLSNRIGTHKARFARVRSPPGFWETDFPTTQERDHEKVEAQRRERQKVEERRREAMRPGGVWVFRDELAK
ncbi:DNA repair protein endonuclease SAE2/CtIP C-terminus-domain-containing protein [Emericellopsis atlantica]|uniref:DNA repair protein endonuclease SAE2/CtIP C-terminus-domain-containing protein n=1 Tax=Emericellopsis atlantica TaxID=2614577 RepID=A0A9P7ZPC0_9HYPO|nr:DNA repair protein endonuclease SAE2/CtIP C-terminus-domain-containing protein [Emericellopsis atlantica]KAG9255804.1 DNA repair protein endonuclease SAE2/CtIP C-terminus-domain-containing protein [Emericellopsis atlantica]